jgi:4-amino-4-deoxy-L-arabinose transferase-like glycosyltransferase
MPPRRLILLLAIVKFMVPFLLIHPMYELHRDEYLYLAESDHLSWGYMEAPPLLALLGWFSRLFGSSFVAVRFWATFFGALNLYLVGRITLQLGGGFFACLLSCLGFLLSGFLRMHILFMPNFLEVFFWTLNFFFIIRLIQDGRPRDLYGLAFSLAMGFLSKYSTVFFLLATAFAFALTPLRTWYRSRHLYYALLLFAVLVLPNAIWQVANRFPVATHMRMLREEQLQYLGRGDFLKDQLLIFFPAFFLWISGLVMVLFGSTGAKYRVIGIIYIGVMAMLLVMKGKSYYSAGLYPVLMAFGGYQLERMTAGPGWRFRLARVVLPAFILLLSLPLIPIALPFSPPEKLHRLYALTGMDKTGLMHWEDTVNHPIPQDFADMLGWRIMAAKVNQVYSRLPDSVKQHTLLFGDNYGEAGALNFYRRQYPLPPAFSDDASFLFWLPSDLDISHIILIDFKPRRTDDIVFGHFRSVQLMDSVNQDFAREMRAKIYLYGDADDSLNAVIRRVIRERKAVYNMK